MGPNRREIAHTSITLVFLLLVIVYRNAECQQISPAASTLDSLKVHLDLKQASMADAIEKLSRATGISIAADGEPREKRADITVDGTGKQALDQVADKFDYTWILGKSGVILMTKRFKNPQEIPQAHASELKQITKDLDRVLSYMPGSMHDRGKALSTDELYRSFTPEQIQTLSSGHVLSGASLTPEQLSSVAESISTHTFGSHFNRWWTSLRQELEALPISSVVLTKPALRRIYTNNAPPQAPGGFDPFAPTQTLGKYGIEYSYRGSSGWDLSEPLVLNPLSVEAFPAGAR